ncbi:MAG: hypothetical protein WCO60_06815 [Verrucomicrobiota bacterium]
MNLRLSVAILVWCSLLATALYPCFKFGGFNRTTRQKITRLFFVLLAIAFPLWRWCSLTYNGEINVDESMVLTQALKYQDDLMPWRAVVADAGGPLNTWVLFWAKPLGLGFGYLTARLTGLFLMFALSTLTVLTLGELLRKKHALLFSIPLLTLLLGTLNLDFLHFSSEQFPAAICAGVLWLLFKQFKHPEKWRAYTIGALCGALPFTKIQVVPGAFFLFFMGLSLPFLRKKFRADLKQNTILLATGGLSIPALILIPVAISGVWSDFIHFYIRFAIGYKNNVNKPLDFSILTLGDIGYTVLLFGSLLLIFATAIFLFGKTLTSKPKQRPVILHRFVVALGLTGYFASLVYAVIKSGFGFPHYLMFLLAPTLVMGAAWIAILTTSRPFQKTPATLLRYALLIFTGVMAIQLTNFSIKNARFLSNWGQEVHPVAEFLKTRCTASDHIAIWGWASKLNVLTQMPPATRFAHTAAVTDPSPEFNRHRETFIADLQASRPKVFLDAVDEFRWYSWPPGVAARHTMIPELSTWIFKNYDFVTEIQTAPNKLPVRIYFLKPQAN